MRRIAGLLVPPLVFLLQATAYAGMHVSATADPVQTAVRLGWVVAAILFLAALITFFLGAPRRCALFVAVATVATMILVGEYALVFFWGVLFATTDAQRLFLWLVYLFVLVPMLMWAARCCLNQSVRVINALKIAVIPAFIPVLYHYLFLK
jgi:hypothetical protein